MTEIYPHTKCDYNQYNLLEFSAFYIRQRDIKTTVLDSGNINTDKTFIPIFRLITTLSMVRISEKGRMSIRPCFVLSDDALTRSSNQLMQHNTRIECRQLQLDKWDFHCRYKRKTLSPLLYHSYTRWHVNPTMILTNRCLIVYTNAKHNPV